LEVTTNLIGTQPITFSNLLFLNFSYAWTVNKIVTLCPPKKLFTFFRLSHLCFMFPQRRSRIFGPWQTSTTQTDSKNVLLFFDLINLAIDLKTFTNHTMKSFRKTSFIHNFLSCVLNCSNFTRRLLKSKSKIIWLQFKVQL
jgi:hypothetical protein